MASQTFASPEIAAAWAQIEWALDEIVALTGGLDVDQLNWRPDVRSDSEAANGLSVLAWHSLGATEQALLFMLCGQEGSRDRAAEFRDAERTSAAIAERWASLRERAASALAEQDASVLDAEFEHPRRGQETGHDLLVGVIQHVGVHLGHAQLTRDLLPG